jgi:hypothetical protein
MRIDLKVSYAEKDKAKYLGARWDAGRRTWYIVDVEDLRPFWKWIPEHLKRPSQRPRGSVSAVEKPSYLPDENEQLKHLRSILKEDT